ncbi:MAG TPA: DUF2752 domain-containing protein [Pyrinomonadaceae bacterium]|nr:DUF2752 domain-containing protein [Pyrinomonadaceae bacterium]
MQSDIQFPVVLPASQRVISGVFAAGMMVGGVLLVVKDPGQSSIFPACPLLSVTGFACPGCGVTRGLHALFHGDVLKALDFNVLIPVYSILLGILLVSLVLAAVRGRGVNFNRIPPSMIYGVLVLGVAFAILRNLPFEPFNILYP